MQYFWEMLDQKVHKLGEPIISPEEEGEKRSSIKSKYIRRVASIFGLACNFGVIVAKKVIHKLHHKIVHFN